MTHFGIASRPVSIVGVPTSSAPKPLLYVVAALVILALLGCVFSYVRLRVPPTASPFQAGEKVEIVEIRPLPRAQLHDDAFNSTQQVEETSSRSWTTTTTTAEGNDEPSPSSPERVLAALLQSLDYRGVRLLLTQTADLLDEEAFLQSSLLNPEAALTRVGVFEENLPALLSALDDVMNRNFSNVSRKDIRVADPRDRLRNKADIGGKSTFGIHFQSSFRCVLASS